MKVKDAIKKILKQLVEFEELMNEEIQTSYEVDELEDFLNIVKDVLSEAPKPIQFILNEVIAKRDSEMFEEDIEEFKSKPHFGICEFRIIKYSDDEFKNIIREFAFADEKGAFVPLDFFYNNEKYRKVLEEVDYETIIGKIFSLLVYLGGSILNNSKDFLSFLNSKYLRFDFSTWKYILIKTQHENPDLEFYSYLYCRYLFKGYRTFLPPDGIHQYTLDSDVNRKIQNPTSLNFLQFFELLDVLDEYHHAPDILSKYLRLYQIIEYLIVRVMLVKIQRNTQKHKLFLREVMSLKKIDDFDKNFFEELFENERSDIIKWFKSLIQNHSIKSEIENYIKSQLDLNNENNLFNSIRKLLYQLRNSIVHSKESEFHITIHTASSETKKLIKKILTKFEKILLMKIASYEFKISYDKRELYLY